eukprot:TRINITY_DN15310_c0_g1_i1.p1 TRINITY_DN15310_c0_g1~~TRINITY_DN15310_c0_g1_i1.p1  ORF type:complete len:522 (+),score=122.04 TRINITY_DN15310_c0_g1_i1:216-1568(+)
MATLNPVWSEKEKNEIIFTLKEPIYTNFKLICWDYDHVGYPDYMGEVEVPPLSFIEKKEYKFTDPLQKKAGYKGAVTGSVSFVWVYVPIEEVKKVEDDIVAQLAAERKAHVQEKMEECQKQHEATPKIEHKTVTSAATHTTTTTTQATSNESDTPIRVSLNVSGTAESPALAKMRHSALLGDAKAAFELGKAYAKGAPDLGIEADDEKALSFYQIAAEDGMPIAQFKVGLFNQMGYGCKVNYGRAFLWYERAVAQNQGDALTALGEFYERGWGVEKNIKQALEYHHRAFDFGFKDSLSHLGRIYKSIGDYDKALEYLNLTVQYDETDADSFYLLGEMYDKGYGIEKNIETAINFYEKSIENENDNRDSLVALINIYVAKASYDKALSHLQNTSLQQDSFCLHLLGEFYEKGYGVQTNIQTAIEYYQKARQYDQLHKESREALKRLGVPDQ